MEAITSSDALEGGRLSNLFDGGHLADDALDGGRVNNKGTSGT
jgi:hypothetical protein